MKFSKPNPDTLIEIAGRTNQEFLVVLKFKLSIKSEIRAQIVIRHETGMKEGKGENNHFLDNFQQQKAWLVLLFTPFCMARISWQGSFLNVR